MESRLGEITLLVVSASRHVRWPRSERTRGTGLQKPKGSRELRGGCRIREPYLGVNAGFSEEDLFWEQA